MSDPITVPAGFKTDFEIVCARLAIPDDDREVLRDKIRGDFSDWGAVVQRMAAIWRYVDKVWSGSLGVGVMPSHDQCEVMLYAMRWMPEEPGMLDRLEDIELVELCGQVDGSIPGPIWHERAYFGTMRELFEYRERERLIGASPQTLSCMLGASHTSPA